MSNNNVQEQAKSVKDTVVDKAEHYADAAHHAKNEAISTLKDTAKDLQDKSVNFAKDLQSKSADLQENVIQYVSKHPAKSLGFAALFGIVLSKLLRK
jgi:ElaB/YqjD/DUF883 family membrane-anchored ribosome-binding protein